MNSRGKSTRTTRRTSTSGIGFALAAILSLSLLQTGCRLVSSDAPGSPSPVLLTQPPVLRLPAGRPVQTLDGTYTPAAAEVWHSDARMRQANQQASDAATALAELKARGR